MKSMTSEKYHNNVPFMYRIGNFKAIGQLNSVLTIFKKLIRNRKFETVYYFTDKKLTDFIIFTEDSNEDFLLFSKKTGQLPVLRDENILKFSNQSILDKIKYYLITNPLN